MRVLEVGVGTGDLLAALYASHAVGVDISPEMLEIAHRSHPELELHQTSAEELSEVAGPFDYVILSDLTVHVYDILGVLRTVKRVCHERTRLMGTQNFIGQLAYLVSPWFLWIMTYEGFFKNQADGAAGPDFFGI